VSELRSAIETYRAESLAELPDALIEENFAELQRAAELIEVERLRHLAEIDRRKLFEGDGHLSAAAWLSSAHKVSGGLARENATFARSLEQMPEAGDVSLSAARELAHAQQAHPEAFSSSETSLVEAARIHRVVDLRRVVAYWREAREAEASGDPEERLRARRRLHASVSFGGMVRVDGDLDPETGETLLTALRAVLDAGSRTGEQDERTPASAAPTRSGRSVGDGSIPPSVRGWRTNDPT
jgi:hypothetical protein